MPKTLGEIAIDAGLVNKAGAARAGKMAEERRQPLVVILVRECGVDELALVGALRKQTRVPLLDPADLQVDPEALRQVPRDVCARLRVLPLGMANEGQTKVLRIAMADPTDTSAVAELEQVGLEVPRVGDLSIVVDGAGTPRALLRTTDVEVVPFEDVERGNVLRGDRRSLGLVGELLAQDVDGGELAARVQLGNDATRILELRAGDVAGRERPHDPLRDGRQQRDDSTVEQGHGAPTLLGCAG